MRNIRLHLSGKAGSQDTMKVCIIGFNVLDERADFALHCKRSMKEEYDQSNNENGVI